MEIEVEITRDDFKKINEYFLKKKTIYKKLVFAGLLIVIGLVILVNIGEVVRYATRIWGVLAQVVAAAAIYSVFVLTVNILNAFLLKRLPGEKGWILGKHKFRLSEEGLFESTEYNENLTRWGGIQSVEETRDYVYIFVDRCMAHVIPKRCFDSEVAVNNLVAYLKAKTGK